MIRLFHPLQWSFQQKFLAGFNACAAVLLYAIYTQYFGGLNPCPLCTFQRGAFVVLATVFLAGAMHNPRRGWGKLGYALVAIATAVAGVVIAARHVWIQQLPPERVPACGPDLDFMLQAWPIGRTLRQVFVGSGDCAIVDWIFLGLSMPAWSAITFAALGVWAALSLARPTEPPRDP